MRTKNKSVFICPETHLPLYEFHKGGKRILATYNGIIYDFTYDIPDLTFPRKLNTTDEKTRSFYNQRVANYDKYLHLTFYTHNEDEKILRNKFIDLLEIKKNYKVLEIASGTGRDSEIIAERLSKGGELYLQDISSEMLKYCKNKIKKKTCKVNLSISNAEYLPFENNYFDALYSFGAIGEFSNIKKALLEMVRVTKKGGKIVFGDEGIPVWLRESEFAKILSTTNPQFMAKIPFEEIPLEAREVRVQWVIGGVFYLIDFRVGEGEPTANFDFEIPGPRGGTYRTRYEGKLEGVTRETKDLAYKAIANNGISMHKWLDDVVKKAALKELEK